MSDSGLNWAAAYRRWTVLARFRYVTASGPRNAGPRNVTFDGGLLKVGVYRSLVAYVRLNDCMNTNNRDQLDSAENSDTS